MVTSEKSSVTIPKKKWSRLSFNSFFMVCQTFVVLKAWFIGLSLFLFDNNYKARSFDVIFESFNHSGWAIVYLAVGTVTGIGIIMQDVLWRIGAAASGSILVVWAFSFIWSGSFRTSPPSFFIWLSAGIMDIMLALAMQPRVIDEFLVEVEKAQQNIQGG